MPADVARLVEAAETEFGAIDVLVNNAGIARPQALDEITGADFDEAIAVNLKSAFPDHPAFLPAMRDRRWGR